MCARRLLAGMPFLVLAIIGITDASAAEHPDQYAVGVAVVDITPGYPVRRNTATSHRAVAAIQSFLNDRPRKRLDYRTPREVLQLWAHRRDVAFGI